MGGSLNSGLRGPLHGLSRYPHREMFVRGVNQNYEKLYPLIYSLIKFIILYIYQETF